jgi:phosphonate transport system substrate-binding protein
MRPAHSCKNLHIVRGKGNAMMDPVLTAGRNQLFAIRWQALLGALMLLFTPWAHALVFAVNEGVTYRVPLEEIRARYALIAADLGKMLGKPVTIEPVGDYTSLRKGLTEKRFDLALVHPAHVSIEAIKGSGYRLVAVTKGFQNYSANFLVNPDSPITELADLKGKRLGAPDEDSITSWMVRAMLRDAGLAQGDVKMVYTRYQDAVPFFVENKLTPAGATAAGGVIKAWTAKGGKVLVKSKAVPIKHVIASPSMSADDVARVREYLLELSTTEEGRKKIEPTKWTGFEAYDEAAMLKLGQWLGL